MRDGEGNKLSPEEQQRVKSIQGDPGPQATTKVSIDPGSEKDTGEADKPSVKPDDKPAAGVGE
ncbi:hypothetical protein [Bosea sp. (in: a-proteobacteria)]|uniref:hypothetical protein n=1 Tax=Bosea sp. (in: a-proteobacteria) TaxID=1871050 RepID=UPI00261C61F4|nr:hypothetical protein [Bosea sp. (in: a-proteobacteria)]MCO5091251.1 hypothetical protein [Bosea sp. (in: a-proteobacteria)]